MINGKMQIEYKEKEFAKVEATLEKVAELLAFVKVYGADYYDYYYELILNINNLSEHYLQSLNSDVIDKLYMVYSTAKKKRRGNKYVFEEIRMVLYNISSVARVEVSDRRKRR